MNTSKILSCEFKNSYDSKYGTFFSHTISLEDGTTGEISAKEQDPSYLQPGQELSYSVKSEDPKYGKKLKRETPNNFGGGRSGGGGRTFDDLGATVGNAMSNAVMLVCHDKVDIKDLKKVAKGIAQKSIEIKSELKTK